MCPVFGWYVTLHLGNIWYPLGVSGTNFPAPHYLLKFAQTHVHWVGDVIQPSHLVTTSSCPQAFTASGPFPKALQIWWPKYWSFSFSICPANEYSGLISFRIDWFDLLAVKGTFESLLQSHSLKASILFLKCILFYLFRLHHMVCGILVPGPGIEPVPPAVETQSLNYWTTREVHESINSLVLSLSYGPAFTYVNEKLLEKPSLWPYGTLSEKWYICFLRLCLDLS